MKHLISSLSVAVILFALFTAPLMVTCIPADGRYLIELVGQDPCHHAHDELVPLTSWNSDSLNASRNCVAPDPCVDLTLDGPAGTQVSADILFSLQQAPDQSIRHCIPGDSEACFTEGKRPSRAPLFHPDLEVISQLPLRI